MIDFLKYRYICAFFSILLIGGFFAAFIYKRATTGQAFIYSVEFTGGTQVLFEFSTPIKSSQVIEILDKEGWSGATTREFGDKELLVRVKQYGGDIIGLGEKMRTALEKDLNGITVKVLQIDSIGQGVGEALSWDSFKAIIIALIAMFIYIGARFWSFPFAFGTLVALFHDAIAILFFFLIFNKEISINVIGAILAVLGYSVNDTIVIFTRIRDNLKTMTHASPTQIANISLNETLRRTTLTSFATSLIVVALIAFGGETLRDLSLALLIGIVFGTYSSIYIASPVMLLFYKTKKA